MPATALNSEPESPTSISAVKTKKAHDIITRYYAQMASHRLAMTGLNACNPVSADVIISTAAKAGTTLLQQITYQILAVAGRIATDPNGDAFDDIGEVVPFLEAADIVGVYKARHEYSPRLWKSHALPSAFPTAAKDARYILCIREGVAVSTSWMDFMLEWSVGDKIDDAEVREEILHQYLMQTYLGMTPNDDGTFRREGKAIGNWFKMVKDWLDADLSNKLFIVYEEMVKNMPATIAKIAEYMSVELSEDQIQTVCERCGREAMAANPRFKDHLMVNAVKFPGPGGVRARSLEQASRGFKGCEIRESFWQEHKKHFVEVFGVEDYKELLQKIRARPDYVMAK